MVEFVSRRFVVAALVLFSAVVIFSHEAAAGTRGFSSTVDLKYSGRTNGPCPFGYADFCRSSGCACDTWNGKVSTPIGKADVELDFTEEDGDIVQSGPAACAPGHFDLSISNLNDEQDWSGAGALCATIAGKLQIDGGAVLGASDVLTSGSAKASATINANTMDMVFHFQGNVK
jgi:hypothetical protein